MDNSKLHTPNFTPNKGVLFLSKNNSKSRSKKTSAREVSGSGSTKLIGGLGMCELFTNIFVTSMFVIFPFFWTNKLFNIRKDRLHYFVATTLVLLFFIAATYICGIDKKYRAKGIFKLSSADIGMLAFLVVCALSALFSAYGMEAVTGESSRNSGLLLMGVYVLCFMLISRYYKWTSLPYDLFIIAGCIVALIAVLNEFYVDPLGVYTNMKESQQDTFISTIGNKNLLSCFLCVVLPVAVVFLVNAKDAALTVFYSIASGITFMGLLVASSDSGYFGIAVFFALLLIYACGTARRMFRYCLSLFSIAVSCKVLRLISYIFQDNMKEIDTIPEELIFNNKVYILIAFAAVVTVAMYLLSRKFGDTHSPKGVRIAAIVLVSLCALAVIVPFVYFSLIDTETDLGSLEKYLRLNDKWGTHRGYAWIRGVKLWLTNGVKNFLIGCGPDTFGQIMKEYYYDDMIERHGSVFDSAHNEYLNYLVTTGLFGLAAYLTAIISVIVRGLKRFKDNVPMQVALFVIITYCAQAMFNLAQPITTPYLFVFLGIAEALIRRAELPQDKQTVKVKEKSEK